MSAQEGVTEEPDSGNGPADDDKGIMRFIRRRPAKEKRSETEWVDTLKAAPEPEQEPVPEDDGEPESPFMAGESFTEEEPEPEPEPEPAPLPELDEEPEPAPQEQYHVERRWRRRHQDEMDEIHNYIDRVIGTDLDPLERHKRLADLGPRRHPGVRREFASVNVEGLDEELMIAFTFPKEELRSARMVYETEGGYVIEVTRAIGGDDQNVERQHYTVSRVGSVAHALDKLRAREIDRRVKGRERATPAPLEEHADEDTMDPAAFDENEMGPSSDDEPMQAGYGSSYTSETSHVGTPRDDAPASETPDPPTPGTNEAEEEQNGPIPSDEAESDAQEKSGLIGGLAGRFKRSPKEDAPEDATETPESPLEDAGEPEPVDEGLEETSDKGGGLVGRFKRKGKEDASDDIAQTEQAPGETEPGADEGPADESGKKKGGLLGLRGRKKRGKKDDEEIPEDDA